MNTTTNTDNSGVIPKVIDQFLGSRRTRGAGTFSEVRALLDFLEEHPEVPYRPVPFISWPGSSSLTIYLGYHEDTRGRHIKPQEYFELYALKVADQMRAVSKDGTISVDFYPHSKSFEATSSNGVKLRWFIDQEHWGYATEAFKQQVLAGNPPVTSGNK